jgi:UDP:flavonoid glycosyltransferase YjiC (YdhE family)
MWLINTDPICLDWHKISAPHYQYIGGLGVTYPQALPNTMQKVMDTAQHGVIVVSFGSALTILPRGILATLFEVFAQLRQEVIMQQDDVQALDVPTNVHVFPWLPQNDLLGNPNTKLFITHGGNNGQLEAVYHGVPMVTLPIFSDQVRMVSNSQL